MSFTTPRQCPPSTPDDGINEEGVYMRFNANQVIEYIDETDSLKLGPPCKIFAVAHKTATGTMLVTLIKMRDKEPGETEWLSWYTVDNVNNTKNSWLDEFWRKLGDLGYQCEIY
jgi:hypothetical protein